MYDHNQAQETLEKGKKKNTALQQEINASQN